MRVSHPVIVSSIFIGFILFFAWFHMADKGQGKDGQNKEEPFAFVTDQMVRDAVACWEKTLTDEERRDYGTLHNATYCLLSQTRDSLSILDSIAWYNKTLAFRKILSDSDVLWQVYNDRVPVVLQEIAARGLQNEAKVAINTLVLYFGQDMPELVVALETKYQATYRCGSATYQAMRGQIDSETPKLICGFVDGLNKDLAQEYSAAEIDDQEWALRRKRDGVAGTWFVILQDLYLKL